MYTLRDFRTKQEVTSNNFVFTGETGPWEVSVDLEYVRSKINKDYFRKSPPFVSKYLPFMPIEDHASFVSLGEGATTLIKSNAIGEQLGIDLYFKLEAQNPTGSFKDRGSAVELTVAKAMGVKAITVASTGNMAASCSCYAAAAKIPCFIFVPEDTPSSKISQAIAYGGRIVQVKGSYNDAAELAQEVAEKLGFYLAGDYAFRTEGQKTAAFELIDQFFYQEPDVVLIPIGCGTNMAAYAKGFEEYKELGFIERIPELIGTQATGASPVVSSFKSGSSEIEPFARADTIAGAIGIADPLDGIKALDAIYKTDGSAVAVTDAEMLSAQYELSRNEGIYVEVSCASTLAALKKLAAKRSFAGKKVVCVLTGAGLKDPTSILKIAMKPPTIYPEVKDFLSLYDQSYFEGRSVSFTSRDKVIFAELPSTNEISAKLREQFEIHCDEEHLGRIHHSIDSFLKKGKPITFSDLQDIIQDVMETPDNKVADVFEVTDFEVQTGKDRKPVAKVTVSIKDEEHRGEADGVGPVDALINALKKACKNSISFALVGYKVDIRSQGTDAVVYVELKLIRDTFVSVGTGTSPDIIQASIEAFEEAYNGFYIQEQ